ncbi:MAG: hypothetical protein GTO18_07070 [Anaerolineales bacterium]|nr:hypothetical protein [Anaerolineales bacterium]
MITLQSLLSTLEVPDGIHHSIQQIQTLREQTVMTTRLRAVTVQEVNPQLISEWRYRWDIRARLRQYTSTR